MWEKKVRRWYPLWTQVFSSLFVRSAKHWTVSIIFNSCLLLQNIIFTKTCICSSIEWNCSDILTFTPQYFKGAHIIKKILPFELLYWWRMKMSGFVLNRVIRSWKCSILIFLFMPFHFHHHHYYYVLSSVQCWCTWFSFCGTFWDIVI